VISHTEMHRGVVRRIVPLCTRARETLPLSYFLGLLFSGLSIKGACDGTVRLIEDPERDPYP